MVRAAKQKPGMERSEMTGSTGNTSPHFAALRSGLLLQTFFMKGKI
jgi:hypothetical protein